MLEKPGAQNIAACENQGKQRKLSDDWKLIKTLFWKKYRGWCKKDKFNWKKLTELQVLI